MSVGVVALDRSPARWVAPAGAAAAIGLGVALGSGGPAGLLLLGMAVAAIALVLPLGWLAASSLLAALAFRLVSPDSTGPLSVAPDALIGLVALRCGAALATRGSEARSRAVWWAGALVVALGLLEVASTLVSGDGGRALVGSARLFLRFPLWAVAILLTGPSWKELRPVAFVLLAASVVQLPLAVAQYRTSGAGDAVSGTFGSGGSGVMMIFLALMAVVWLALALQRAIPAWLLLILGPALIVPMGLGSAAMFVVFVPIGILAVFVRQWSARSGGLRLGVVAGLSLVLAVGGWAARTFAVAPPCAGCQASAATSIYSNEYLTRYYRESLLQGPDSRLGFLVFALRVDAEAGPTGLLLGQGPGQSFVGGGSTAGKKLSLSRFRSLETRSLQSLQRMLLGLGIPALALYVLLICVMGFGTGAPNGGQGPGLRRGIVLAMPAATLLMLMAAPYTAAWSDPGVAGAFWGMVVLARSSQPAPDAGLLEGA
jgi:hypothetical protein